MNGLRRCSLGLLAAAALRWRSAPHRLGRPSSEEDVATARRLAQEAQTALDAKDYQTAVDKFRRAEALYHAPPSSWGWGEAYVGLGKLVRARESYNKVLREQLPKDAPPAFVQAVKTPRPRSLHWRTRLPGHHRRSRPGRAGGQARRRRGAGRSPGRQARRGSGDHVVTASAAGFSSDEKRFSVQSGASTPTLPSRSPPNPLRAGLGGPTGGGGPETGSSGDTQFLVGILGLGVGFGGLVVGIITGAVAMDKHSDLVDACPDNQCPPAEQDTLDAYHTYGLVSTIGFIAGASFAAAGLVVMLTAPSSRRSKPDRERGPRARSAERNGPVLTRFGALERPGPRSGRCPERDAGGSVNSKAPARSERRARGLEAVSEVGEALAGARPRSEDRSGRRRAMEASRIVRGRDLACCRRWAHQLRSSCWASHPARGRRQRRSRRRCASPRSCARHKTGAPHRSGKAATGSRSDGSLDLERAMRVEQVAALAVGTGLAIDDVEPVTVPPLRPVLAVLRTMIV